MKGFVLHCAYHKHYFNIPVSKIIAVVNQKGGVGKTTTCVNLSASLVAAKRHVLLVDMDPQGNATTGSGCEKNEQEYTVCDVLLGKIAITELVQRMPQAGYDLVPANGGLTVAEASLLREELREQRLANALTLIKQQYDYILIDCPPSLNMLTINALVAADSVLIPMQCEYYALEGLSSLVETIEILQNSIKPRLYIEGLLRTMYDSRNCLTQEVTEQLILHFGDQVFHTVIPRNVRLAEAASHGLPTLQYDKRSVGAEAYLALAGELIRRHQQPLKIA